MLRHLPKKNEPASVTVLVVLFLGTVTIGMGITMSCVGTVLFVKLFRLFEIVAFAGNTKNTKRKSNQEKFHRAPSLTTRRPNATLNSLKKCWRLADMHSFPPKLKEVDG